MPLSIAFSPCPNDTFVFHALVHGLVPGTPGFDVTYADVDVTNTAAQADAYDLVKVSYAALPWLLDRYTLLPCGGALGRGCGPLVLVGDPAAVPDLAGRSVAVPGDRTTAYLLMRLWSAERPPASVTVVPFAEIMPAVAAGRFDAGLVIHEARFTYPEHGLHALVDLGEWWESATGLPIPLGAILLRRPEARPDARPDARPEARPDAQPAVPRTPAAGFPTPEAVAEWIRTSVRHAWADPAASEAYVLAHAKETAPDVVRRHIDLYVNAFTENLGEEGYAAADELLRRAAAAGLTPPAPRLR